MLKLTLYDECFNMTQLSPRYVAFAGFLLCFFAMAAALYLQYFGGLEPCPLCTFQRVGYVVAGLVFLVAALHNPKKTGRIIYTLLLSAASRSEERRVGKECRCMRSAGQSKKKKELPEHKKGIGKSARTNER